MITNGRKIIVLHTHICMRASDVGLGVAKSWALGSTVKRPELWNEFLTCMKSSETVLTMQHSKHNWWSRQLSVDESVNLKKILT